MSHKNKPHPSKPFAGSVELIPLPPKFTEFIDAHRLWGFPIQQLRCFVLEENPERRGQAALPPDQLILVYETGLVVLKGWRLELMAGPLVIGRIARVHAEKHLGALIIEEAWVSEIRVIPFEGAGLQERGLETPVATRKQP
jgi:hypothetical protein